MIDRAVQLVTGRRSKVAVLVAFVLLAAGLASQSGKLSDVTRSDRRDAARRRRVGSRWCARPRGSATR